MNGFSEGFSLGPGSGGAESLTDVDIFFHPWVKMSSISFYSSFVTSLLSREVWLPPSSRLSEDSSGGRACHYLGAFLLPPEATGASGPIVGEQ